ncbi:MAG: tetratricopeptide repeat protein [Deltaproteobacteria bacterium]|nr:tetratricopeptide repeat protein [Deltaproteobacteria bacterium]
MAPKKKISRKELLKKPDEFITTSNRIYAWISQNLQSVILVGVAVILVVAALWGYLAYRSYREAQSQQKYFAAVGLKESEQQITKLKAVTGDFPGTSGSAKAWVSLGHLYFEKKDYPQAIQAYQTALNNGRFPQDFQTLIRENLAYALEEKGDLKGAAALFTQILNGTDPLLKENAHLNLARVYQKMNQTKEAKTTLQNFLKAYPNSNYAPMVRDRLARL